MIPGLYYVKHSTIKQMKQKKDESQLRLYEVLLKKT